MGLTADAKAHNSLQSLQLKAEEFGILSHSVLIDQKGFTNSKSGQIFVHFMPYRERERLIP